MEDGFEGDKLKVKMLEKNENKIKFILDANPQFANALRRIIISEVPNLAIETVDFVVNDSALFNEIIAHRLGLIPLTFDSKALNLPKECKCGEKGCSQCQVVLSLDKKGPCSVYSKDLKSSDKYVQPLFLDMPIVELLENQRLKFDAIAVLGLGKEHAKWQVAKAWYRYYPNLTISPNKNLEKYVEICPKNALKVQNNKLVLDSGLCDICKECFKLGEIEIKGDENKLIFTLESISGLKPKEIVLTAIGILEKKAKEFGKQIKKLK